MWPSWTPTMVDRHGPALDSAARKFFNDAIVLATGGPIV